MPDRQSTRATRAGLSGPPLATLLLLAAASIAAAQPPALSTSPPEAQGVSTTRLFASADSVGLLPKARALLVARHGTLILERYYRGMSADSIWDMKSVTKSVQSALIGIAIGDHLVAGLDARVAGAMPDRFPMLPVGLDLTFASWIAGNDSLHRTVTVRDLLTMRSGFQGSDLDLPYILLALHASDAVRFVAELPMDTVPGARFRYWTGNAMLLNGLLATATGKSPRAFAQERLFGPIGVEIRRWTVDRAGLETGGSELYLTARDMLRFGLLYLAHGSSRGRQIIPVAWVDSTLAQYVRFESPPADAAARMLPGGTGYGLMWWHRQSGARRMSCAWGTGGQLICLVPELDLAVVLLSTLDGNPPDYYARLFELVDRDMVGAARP